MSGRISIWIFRTGFIRPPLPESDHRLILYAGLRFAGLDRFGEGDLRIRHGGIESQMNGRFAAAVPVTVSNSGRKDDKRAGSAVVLLTLDLDAHCTAQDVEDLIDGVNVHAGG